ncbi:hypothetical protein [Luteibacter sp. 3190]|uniref:hypothetical protein n=1 Tax=Luteibacter sp. 3190 TaxID=2817736 RepID=UPI00285DE162|nr:hypothetical protein [Luteibacter sp. 3190]MDR6935700.1 hypothetical protein [Luteibacter sp. 3190]
MDLYENTLIGTFLYGLGIEMGTRLGGAAVVSGVDLLQQTPLDQSLGDVLIKAPRHFRLFEFKRATNRDPKEAEKRSHLLMAMDKAPNGKALFDTSRAIHSLVRIDQVELTNRRLETKLAERAYVGGELGACTIPELCRRTAHAMLAADGEPNARQCDAYLRLLADVSGRLKHPTGGGGTLLVAARDGIVEYAHVAQISDIFRTHEQLRGIQAAYERAAKGRDGKERERGDPNQREIRGKDMDWER